MAGLFWAVNGDGTLDAQVERKGLGLAAQLAALVNRAVEADEAAVNAEWRGVRVAAVAA